MVERRLSKPSLRDWARSVPASAGMLTALLTFDLPLRAIGRSGDATRLMLAAQLLGKLLLQAFRMTGATLEVEGEEHLEPGRRYLVMANHQGFSDVIVLSKVLARYMPRYVAKRELASGWPSVSYVLAASGSAIIDRKRPSEAVAEIERLGRQARREGWSVVIFPEGTRAKDGVPRRWKVGGARALVETVGLEPQRQGPLDTETVPRNSRRCADGHLRLHGARVHHAAV